MSGSCRMENDNAKMVTYNCRINDTNTRMIADIFRMYDDNTIMVIDNAIMTKYPSRMEN
jgi:hypothetical protein